MPSKKKSRPLFEVPGEIGLGGDSGWVYRSETGSAGEASPMDTDTGVGATAATTMAITMVAVMQVMVFGMTMASIPLRVLNALANPGGKPAS